MKTKIFALMTAVLCLCMCFASCDEKVEVCEAHVDENADSVCDVCSAEIVPEVVCTEHKDEDANKECDVCGKSIVSLVVVEKPADAEEFQGLVVKDIPTDANPLEYIQTELPEKTYAAVANDIDGRIDTTSQNYALVIKRVTVDTVTPNYSYNTYRIYDLATGKMILDAGNDNDYNLTETKSVSVSFGDGYFSVATRFRDPSSYDTTKYEIKYYTYAAQPELIAAYSWDQGTATESYSAPRFDLKRHANDLYYFEHDDQIYVVDTTSGKVIYTKKAVEMVYRPDMDGTQANVGYTFVDGKVRLYDLTKWIDCTFTYDLPYDAGDVKTFQLANGNVLVQYLTRLSDLAVSYDYIDEDGYKIDIDYILIDAAAEKATEVEFGYYIESAMVVDDGNALFKDTVDNIFTVRAIKDTVVATESKNLVIGNDLSILLEIKIDLNARIVDNSLYAQEVAFNGLGHSLTALVDINGNLKSYVDDYNTSLNYYGVKVTNGKVYDYDNNVIFDLNDGWHDVAGSTNFLILSQTEATEDPLVFITRYYLYEIGKAAPVEIGKGLENFSIAGTVGDTFVVSYTKNTEVVYELYDLNNQKLGTSALDIDVNSVSDAEGNVIYYATLNNPDAKLFIFK